MNDSELSEEVRGLIGTSVPSIDALELLMLLARNPAQAWTAQALVEAIRSLKESDVRQYLELFREQRLLGSAPGGAFFYKPATPTLESAAAALRKAYNERPVTLIRTIYAIADGRKIQAFADAFRLKKDP